ncbi:methyltransferase [Paenibacillus baekrokdamisoli]|uniref:Methyltransferase n=1 Tax=Paenibacillus baekrokdamisoli TaxID=1712516 RepID=A0A3G9IT80_9BACL|nr:class I SAM-dependent methyltransferase [Paenibacillus baekrokdamisoli]MBB3071045.1 ubiquinone/menaquinone biosynthesis C-methylase UbiE [Paenibacillus baekrokdamisoli]BBH21462.1 methyltransferase [Paenibacillus baekrokdamisoli]
MTAWYERSFGSDYMIVYRHRNWQQAETEVQRMASWLALPDGASILDIGCGMGRHALALANLGFHVTGIDLSNALLEKAREHNIEGLIEKLVQGDMRELPFEDGQFQATVNLFTSFGYFPEESDNSRVLKEIRRVLQKDGRFLIDFMNGAYVKANLVSRSERIDEESGLHIEEVRAIENDWVVKKINIGPVGKNEESRSYEERVQLLPLDWFRGALIEAGLTLEQVFGNYEGDAYDVERSPRIIMVGRVSA